ncbi:DUF4268 domain-containing protein [Hydromonas duriensis]|uniref:Uncharacterized protein DUF4268 n=1 Tax=Hydromonas duriensis TaxID=1527608 RepID=A0A4R6Y815_9BURK|nr:DUF4268 domain-containing protein [Hydromonas duriensis]TDR31520.1 uncharacterized protein DUF4268 [Hydromonas duriensis]
MYQINGKSNRIEPLTMKSFNELGFTERNHLQEWLAHQPSALGEELLIIQKEFDGFDETRERLDLLAVDKDGNLVIIENKLDDSGRDVVWQALKYASYFSSSSKQDIIDVYQKYLNRHHTDVDAQQSLCEFLDVPDIDELKINVGNNQRIILVAAKFRREVTSTALWLLEKGIDVACFKVTPYALNENILLNIEQIVPTPETKELMIGLSKKEAEEKNVEVTLKKRHNVRYAFWEKILESFKKSNCALYNNISPSHDHWLSAGSGISGCVYTLIFGHKQVRVEWNMVRRNTEENKQVFDSLFEHKSEIEQRFGAPLVWKRMDDRISSRVQYAFDVDGHNPDNWGEIINWLISHVQRLEIAIKPLLPSVSQLLRERE